ncbi:MAG: sel1 repeat family protein [Nitrospira sp.]|jgi:TPR repeat protein|nr:sel1 repeat family protein [Nitrospira sp.]MDH4242657.1 sel1 repeat family protein [Nitrospira sp.]MDH4355232.1 sel1 repeat family protein [Nitrospira sp.]MDH5318535.1 sel1 repeat family protein [Nitrospira sp.]
MQWFFPMLLMALTCVAGAQSVVAAGSLEEAEFAYDRGEYTKAARLFSPLAEQGVAAAQFYLGLMHDRGRGVRQDYQTAVVWFRKAAAQGYPGSQSNLGLIYERGRGVRKDLVRALMWYHVAGALLDGDEGKAALKRRDFLISKMTAAQIEQAQEMARRCQQSQFQECD